MMSSPQQAMPFRLAHSSLRLALRFWPEESRDWGHALAAELHEIEKPFEALRWALGGLMLFSRASASHYLTWLKLPAGARLSGTPIPGGGRTPILPKRSRLFTAAILVATALLLFIPHSREALSTLRASWNGYQISSADRGTLADLATKAEKDNDAKTLAFVALATPESKQGMRLAEKAVALDSNLSWIYASRFYRPDDVPPPAEWLARLRASDPGNSFVDLCAADAIAHARFRALIAHHTPSRPEIEAAIVANPQWVAQMEAALRAPRYDSYLTKHWELIAYVWNRDPSLSPSIIGYGLWSHRIPDITNVRIFTAFQIHRAQQAQIEGHPENAEKILKEIDSLGNRMVEAGNSAFETLVGWDLSRQASKEFKVLYTAMGQKPEAQQAAVRVQQLEELQKTFHRPYEADYRNQQKAFRGYAALFETTSILVIFFASAMVLSYLILELRPSFSLRRAFWQRILCKTADFAPASILFLCGVFLLSYLPFARLFAGYRSRAGTSATFRGLSSTLWELVQFRSSLEFLFEDTLKWWAFTIGLSLLAIFVVIRGFYRPRPAIPLSS
jgi:hypothetical protein